MRRILLAPALVLTLALGGCPDDEGRPPATTKLPEIPADIRACFRESGVAIPDRDLTVGDVERLWKTDRVRLVVMRRCGVRLVAFYDGLRRTWR